MCSKWRSSLRTSLGTDVQSWVGDDGAKMVGSTIVIPSGGDTVATNGIVQIDGEGFEVFIL
jgi:hypothetical protein